MDFFEGFGKKLSQVGQSAAQKTKGMTDIAKINGAISDEEKKLNNNYCQIGKLYVAMHSTDYESNFAGMVGEVKESERKIVEYRQQIKDIKGVVKCERCGAEVDNGAAFCSSCGAPMLEQEYNIVNNANMMRCTNCGAMIEKNARFCISCGQSVNIVIQPQTVDTEETLEQITATPMNDVEIFSQQESFVQFENPKCPNCGAEIVQDSMFCTECGFKL